MRVAAQNEISVDFSAELYQNCIAGVGSEIVTIKVAVGRTVRQMKTMAARLGTALRQLPQIAIAYRVESNGVFAKIPSRVVDGLHQRGWKFYTGVVTPDESRLMCSWDTTPDDVDAFAKDVGELARNSL